MSDKDALYRELLPLLDSPMRPDRDGRVWSYCPVHGDGTKHRRSGSGQAGRSLSLHPAMGLQCFAGCDFKALLTALRGRNGAAPGGGGSAHGGGAKWEIVATYDYLDPYTGKVVAHKVRFERDIYGEKKREKKFTWKLPGASAYGLGGKIGQDEMPLLGADAVLFADAGQRIWWAEGEKAKAAIERQGEICVCSGYGSTETEWTPEVLAPLKGRDVLVWPDNDAVGRKFARHVKASLRGIAKSVAIINAPGEIADDAYDYFARGGKVEDLLTDVLSEPTTDVLANDHFVVRVPTEHGIIRFAFEEMTHGRNSLEADLTVSNGPGTEPYNQWINLKSQSTRDGLRRALEAQFGKDHGVNWTEAVSIAYSRVRKAYESVDRSIGLGDMPIIERPRWLVEGLLPEGAPSVFFGRGSSLKSFAADAVVLAVAMGAPDVLGLPVVGYGGVLVVDYEDPRALSFRLRRLLLGMALDPDILPGLPIRLWPTQGEPLRAMTEGIVRACEHMADAGTPPKLIVVDSAMMACGGEPEKSEPALQMFNALERIGLTSLIISHVSNAESDLGLRRPYGTVVWENAPRRTYAFDRTSDVDTDDITVAVINQKSNVGKKLQPWAFHAHFEGEGGPVTLEPTAMEAEPDFDRHRPVADRAWELLRDHGVPMQIIDIAKELDVMSETVRKALQRGEGERFQMVPRVGTGGKDRWLAVG